MGIRFFCPNGHKLNVKQFQAGRKAICPFCGAKTQIPTQSTRKSSREERADRRAGTGGAASAVSLAGGDPMADAGASLGLSFPPVASPDAAGQGESFLSAPRAAYSAPQPTSPPQGAAAPAGEDPFLAALQGGAGLPGGIAPSPPGAAAEDPLTGSGEMIWYVRPPSGGQFGPAGRDLMRTWLAEGRISADSLVWREGWRDWLEASQVFPQLAGGLPAIGLGALLESEVPVAAAMPRTFGPAARHKSRSKQTVIVVALLAAAVALLVVLLCVLYLGPDNSAEKPPDRDEAPAAAAPASSTWSPAARPWTVC
jgi:hypothetical protein